MDVTRVRTLIAKHEGRRNYSYWDTATPRRRTVGIGFNMDDKGARLTFSTRCPDADFDAVYQGKTPLTDAQIDALFKDSFDRAVYSAHGLVSGFDSLPDDAQAVVVDMIFNLGAGRFGGFNKLRLALAKRDFKTAADEMVNSAWYEQVKSRAVEDVALMRGCIA